PMDPDRDFEEARRNLDRRQAEERRREAEERQRQEERARRRQEADAAGPPSPLSLTRLEWERVRDWLDELDGNSQPNALLPTELLDALRHQAKLPRRIDAKLDRLIEPPRP